MIFKIGSVYRDPRNGVHFIAIRHSYDVENNLLTFHLVNAANWIVLETITGKVMPDGTIGCQQSEVPAFELAYASVNDFYYEVD